MLRFLDSIPTAVAIGACILLAINVGGNNAAAEMAPAFGAGVRSKRESAILAGIFAFFGAIIAGGTVVGTLSGGLLKGGALEGDVYGALIVISTATSMIAVANIFKLPIATAHAMVGAVIGFGLANSCVRWEKALVIVAWWVVTPFMALLLSYLAGRHVHPRFLEHRPESQLGNLLYRGFLTLTGCYLAFSAGANGLAKAIAPLVGAGVLEVDTAALYGGLAMALGAILISPALLHVVGKEITPVTMPKAVMLEVICGSILLAASVCGIPVSLAEIVTCSVIGFSCAHSGLKDTLQNLHVARILKLWLVCPLYTCLMAYCLEFIFQ